MGDASAEEVRMPRRPEEGSTTSQTAPIPYTKLDLDPENPRLDRSDLADQDEILEVLWASNSVDEVLLSIATSGYFHEEPMLVEQTAGGRYTVLEGNRRLAAIRILLDDRLATRLGVPADLRKTSAENKVKLQQVPCLITTRRQAWRSIGFKHINGPRRWDSYNKAQYISQVHQNFSIPLDQIARTIGDRFTTVRRLYRGLTVLRQAEEQAGYSVDDRQSARFSFSHLYTALEYPNTRRFLGLPDVESEGDLPKAPLHRKHLKNAAELLVWLFGSKDQDKPALIRSQNPDLRKLEETLGSDDGIAALRSGIPLDVAVQIAVGDQRIFREALVEAKHKLQEAAARVATGYQGEKDVLDLAREAFETAKSLYRTMRDREEKDVD